jgi:hypothetical protein
VMILIRNNSSASWLLCLIILLFRFDEIPILVVLPLTNDTRNNLAEIRTDARSGREPKTVSGHRVLFIPSLLSNEKYHGFLFVSKSGLTVMFPVVLYDIYRILIDCCNRGISSFTNYSLSTTLKYAETSRVLSTQP